MPENLVLMCLIVYFARILDTSLGTVKTMLIVKNKTFLAMIIAFLEVTVWFFIVREALNTEEYIVLVAMSYALGYATGVYVGMYLTDRFVTSNVTVNIVVKQDKKIVKTLVDNGYAISVSKIQGKDLVSNKYMILVCTTNKKVKKLKDLVTSIDSHAFIVVSDNKFTIGGY
jgi:uncharacterized protein YebE (UPF0316 family)